jgi:hypothetical protein
MHATQLQEALRCLTRAIRDVEVLLDEMRSEHDPLAVHIFIARRIYRHARDTKSGKRRETSVQLSWQRACELGFRGSLGDWERLLGAAPKR